MKKVNVIRDKASSGSIFRKAISLICALAVIMTSTLTAAIPAAAAITQQGNDGYVKWSVTDAGVLTVSPVSSSAMSSIPNYENAGYTPWYAYRNNISSVAVEDGISYVGKNSFCGMDRVERVTLGKDVKSIGEAAFRNCYSLKYVTVGRNCTTVSNNAFFNSNNLISVSIPPSVTVIGDDVFSPVQVINSYFSIRCAENSRIYTYAVNNGYSTATQDWDYVCEFNTNGGNCSTSSKTVTYGGTYGELPTPSKTGYTFAGWYLNNQEISSNSNVTTASDHTLTAKYTANSYKVTLNANGGACSTSSKIVIYGSTYGELPTPSKSGYTFAGWYLNSQEITSASNVTTASDHTLTAKYTANNYKVTLNANGGACSTSSKIVTYGNTYGELPIPSRVGYTFESWYLYNQKITPNSNVTTASDHTLTAKYTANMYKVFLNANGGACSTSSISVTYDGKYGTLPTPVMTGYAFDGWYLNNQKITSNSNVTTASDHILEAKYRANQYTVSFDADGGECETISKPVTYGSEYGELPTPSKTGYAFKGWYLDNQRITENTSVSATENHILTAQYEANYYIISFNSNGGNCETVSQLVTYGSEYGTLPPAVKTGYTFKGWYLDDKKITETTKVATALNHILVAQYASNSYALTLEANGGDCDIQTVTVTYNGKYGYLPTPVKKGYYFSGWFTNDNKQIFEDTIFTDESVDTLYARYVKIITKPTGLSAKYLSKTSVKLSWNKQSDIDGYEVYKKTGTDKYSLQKRVSGTSVTLKLSATKAYKFKIRAYVYENGILRCGAYSSSVSRPKAFLSKPKLKNNYSQSNKMLKVSWKAVKSAKKYEIYRLKNNKWKKVKTTTSLSFFLYAYKGNTYSFKVRAVTTVMGHKVYSKYAKFTKKI